MRLHAGLAMAALLAAGSGRAALKPEAYRLASLPANVEPGQKLVLCAANIGTGGVDVSMEFINVATGAVAAEKTVTLRPLGGGGAAAPCVTLPAGRADGEAALVVGVAMVRKPLLSFREAQVTASIQVMAPDAKGVAHTVAIIPLSRTAHPVDVGPVYAPAAMDGGHHR